MGVGCQVSELARIGFESVELTVIPGWSTELDTLDAAEQSYAVLSRAFEAAGIERERGARRTG